MKPKNSAADGVYIAWLRAINVGGNRMVKMDDLKKIFAKLGCLDVRTLINSGNVVFRHAPKSEAALRTLIETTLEKALGFDVTTVLRTKAELEALVKLDPFKDVTMDADTRIYVTFLADEPSAAAWKDLMELAVDGAQEFTKKGRELFTVYRVKIEAKQPFSNTQVEKVLGTRATTRGWPTVLKVLALAQK
ncbi:MAG TPA: DUF1697 domain-containing protein [Candidatus Peribacteria bacterium]|nr:DUF1697 domain-containing protein [Candidatus Peribacteria bacterium]